LYRKPAAIDPKVYGRSLALWDLGFDNPDLREKMRFGFRLKRGMRVAIIAILTMPSIRSSYAVSGRDLLRSCHSLAIHVSPTDTENPEMPTWASAIGNAILVRVRGFAHKVERRRLFGEC